MVVLIEVVGACLRNKSVGHACGNIAVSSVCVSGASDEVNVSVLVLNQAACVRLAVLEEADISVGEVVQAVRQLADMNTVLVELMVLIFLLVRNLNTGNALVNDMVRETGEAVQLAADGIPSGAVLLAAGPDKAGSVVMLNPGSLVQVVVHKLVSDSVYGLLAVHGGTGSGIEVIVRILVGRHPAGHGIAVHVIMQLLADHVEARIVLKGGTDTALRAAQLSGFRIQLVAVRAGAGLIGCGIGVKDNRTAVLAHAVGRDGQLVLVRLDGQEQRAVLLRDKREVERRVVHGCVVQVAALLAQVSANVVHCAALGNLSRGHSLGTGVCMVMSGEHDIDSCGIDRCGNNVIEACASAVLVGVIGRLMDGQELPCGVACLRIRNQPLQCLVPVGVVVDNRDIHIAVLHRVVAALPHVGQDIGCRSVRVAVVLVVSVGMDHADAVELVAEDILNLLPHRIVAAVVHVVTGLDAEVGILGQVGCDGCQQCDVARVGRQAAAHLGIAHHEEVGLKGIAVRCEGADLGPVSVGAVADTVNIGVAGFQTRQRDGIQEGGVLGGQEGMQHAVADGLVPGGLTGGILLGSHVLRNRIAGGGGGVCHPCKGLFVIRVIRYGGHDRGRRAVGRAGDRVDHHRGGEGHHVTLAGGDSEGCVALHGSGGGNNQLAVLIGNTGDSSVDQHLGAGNGIAVHIGHGGGSVEARQHDADVHRVGRAQVQLNLAVGCGGGLAGVVHAVHFRHPVGEEINLGIQRCRNGEGQHGRIDIGGRVALADPVRVELNLGSLEAGGCVDHLAFPAVREGNGGLTEVGVDLQERHVEGLDRAARAGSQRVGKAHGNDGLAQEQGGSRHRLGIIHKEVAQHGSGVAEAVADRNLRAVDAVGQFQTRCHGCGVAVARDFLAVDGNGGQLRVDAGGVLAVHIMEQGCQGDVGVIDGHNLVLGQGCAVDGNAVDNRVVQVVQVGTVDKAVVIEIQSARIPSGAVGLTGLIAQPEQTAAGNNRNRMLLGRVGRDGGQVGIAVHPAFPVNIRNGSVAVLQGEVLGRVVAAVPDLDVGVQEVPMRAAVGVDPYTQLGGRAVNVDRLVAAVADVEVGVLGSVVGGVIVVELQGVLAEAYLSALGGCRCRHAAGVFGRDGVVGPEVEGIPVGIENIRCGNTGVPVAGEGKGSCDFSRFRVIRIPSACIRGHGRYAAGILAVAGLAPVEVRTGQSAVLVRLEVKRDNRHLSDFHADGSGQHIAGGLGIGGGHGSAQGGGGLTGNKILAVHVAQCVIRHAVNRGLECP